MWCVWSLLGCFGLVRACYCVFLMCLDVSGCVWLCVDVAGCVWLCRSVSGCVWMCLAVSGCVWLCRAVSGCVWMCLDVSGCVWLCLDVSGCVWMCFDEYGGVATSLAVEGCSLILKSVVNIMRLCTMVTCFLIYFHRASAVYIRRFDLSAYRTRQYSHTYS